MKLAEQYIENERKIKDISERLNKFREKERNKTDKIVWSINDKIRELEREKGNAETKTYNIITERKKKAKIRIDKLDKTIIEVERILYFLRLKPKEGIDFDVKEEKNYRYDRTDSPAECWGNVIKDKFIKVALFVYENSKPKNKYSLVAVGRSVFKEKMLPFRYDYGIDLNIFGSGFTVAHHIKDLPTKEELKAYLEKHKPLEPHICNYNKLKAEYLNVLKQFKLSDFRAIMKYRCKKCGMLTEREGRNNYCCCRFCGNREIKKL